METKKTICGRTRFDSGIDSEGTKTREVLHHYDWQSFSLPVPSPGNQPETCTLPCAHHGPSCRQSVKVEHNRFLRQGMQYKSICNNFLGLKFHNLTYITKVFLGLGHPAQLWAVTVWIVHGLILIPCLSVQFLIGILNHCRG